MRYMALLALFVLASVAATQEPKTEGPPEHGHGLTAKGAMEGWISLFDGKTTFGWTGAKLEAGSLIGGKSTTEFGPCSIRAFFTHGGTLTVGGQQHDVEEGTFSLEATDGGRIELGKGAAARALVACPLKLKALFNGTDMDGWKRIDHPKNAQDKQTKWRVDDGKIIAVGGPGAIEYTKEKFGDLVIQVEARTRAKHVNGGVFFRCIPKDFMNGYEMQIYNRCKDGDPAQPVLWTTGGIDDRQNARRLISRDLEPFKLTVIARGPHLSTWVNGYQVTDWNDDRAPDANPRKGRRVEAGTIQLQAHDAETNLEYRDVRGAGLK